MQTLFVKYTFFLEYIYVTLNYNVNKKYTLIL